MTIDFSKTNEVVTTPVEGVTISYETTCCAPHPQNVQVPAVFSPTSDSIRLDKIVMPRLNLVQSTGQLKDSFPQGAIVYAQSQVLFEAPVVNLKTGAVEKPGTPPVIITALKFNDERFIEKVEGGIGGQIVNTEDEVRAAGGTLSYKEWEAKKSSGIKRFGPMADALFAIQRPERCADDDTTFVYEVDGLKYALALWSLAWTTYTSVAKGTFYTQKALGCLRNGYQTYSFGLSTRLSPPRNGNRWHEAVLIKHKPSTPAFLEFAAAVIGA